MPLPDYTTLRDHVQGILSEGQSHARQATAWERVDTYWHVGDAVLSHIDAQPRADYGQQVIPNLSNDIGLSQSVLWDILRFRRLVPILPTRRELTWSHYRRLAHVGSQDQFRYYERLAEEQRLSVEQLAQAIRDDAFTTATTQPFALPADADPATNLRARFGSLYSYRVTASPNPTRPKPCLDIGFHINTRLPLLGLTDPQPGHIVTSTKRSDGSYHFAPAASTQRYTYVAWVHRVVDGDTFTGAADPGLGLVASDLRFRLRGIDAPELNTLAGRNARAFVTETLAAVDFVVVRTHRTDSFGRYLVDVRYLPGESDPHIVRASGIYLNRQLLQERLAVPFER